MHHWRPRRRSIETRVARTRMVSPAENSSTPLLFQNPAARRPTALQTSRKNRQGETNAVVRAAGKRRVEAPTRREMEVLSSDISRTLVKAHGRVQSAARTRVRAEYRLARHAVNQIVAAAHVPCGVGTPVLLGSHADIGETNSVSLSPLLKRRQLLSGSGNWFASLLAGETNLAL